MKFLTVPAETFKEEREGDEVFRYRLDLEKLMRLPVREAEILPALIYYFWKTVAPLSRFRS